MNAMTQVPLVGRESEALLWGLSIISDIPDRPLEGPSDPVQVLLNEGFSRPEIVKVAEEMCEFCYDKQVAEPLTDLQKAILRVCVENTTFVKAYYEFDPPRLDEAKKALRDLATKLEHFDIEVNHIPNH